MAEPQAKVRKVTPKAREVCENLAIEDSFENVQAAKSVLKRSNYQKKTAAEKILAMTEKDVATAGASEVLLWRSVARFSTVARSIVLKCKQAPVYVKKLTEKSVQAFSDADWGFYARTLTTRMKSVTMPRAFGTCLSYAVIGMAKISQEARRKDVENAMITGVIHGCIIAKNDTRGKTSKSVAPFRNWLGAQKKLTSTLKLIYDTLLRFKDKPEALHNAVLAVTSGDPASDDLFRRFWRNEYVMGLVGADAEGTRRRKALEVSIANNHCVCPLDGASLYQTLQSASDEFFLQFILKVIGLSGITQEKIWMIANHGQVQSDVLTISAYMGVDVDDSIWQGLLHCVKLRDCSTCVWPAQEFSRLLRGVVSCVSKAKLTKIAASAINFEEEAFFEMFKKMGATLDAEAPPTDLHLLDFVAECRRARTCITNKGLLAKIGWSIGTELRYFFGYSPPPEYDLWDQATLASISEQIAEESVEVVLAVPGQLPPPPPPPINKKCKGIWDVFRNQVVRRTFRTDAQDIQTALDLGNYELANKHLDDASMRYHFLDSSIQLEWSRKVIAPGNVENAQQGVLQQEDVQALDLVAHIPNEMLAFAENDDQSVGGSEPGENGQEDVQEDEEEDDDLLAENEEAEDAGDGE